MSSRELTWEEEQEIQEKRDTVFLEQIKQEVSKEMWELIDESISESEGGSNFRIEDKPQGDFQDCNEPEWFKEWVDQWAVGESGDSWAGQVYVELKKGRYLVWDYSM